MSDRETFGPRLRAERERRGISLDTIASVTRVSAELWDGLERNDFSRWPSGIFARAFVRDYARAIGVDADEVVNEFCRLFPIGDRRASRLIQAQAELIGHPLEFVDSGALPPEGDRRTAAPSPRPNRAVYGPRVLAAAIDTACTLGASGFLSLTVGAPFWASAGVISLLYYTAATILLSATPGARASSALAQRMPALFAVHDGRRATV